MAGYPGVSTIPLGFGETTNVPGSLRTLACWSDLTVSIIVACIPPQMMTMLPMTVHTGERPFPCPHPGCGMAFTQGGALDKHFRIHTARSRTYNCTHSGCGKAFKSRNELALHIRTHAGDKPYRCTHPGCSKAFTAKSALESHMRIHSGEQQYSCKHPGCGKTFAQSSDRNKHMSTRPGQEAPTHHGSRRKHCLCTLYRSVHSSAQLP